MNDYIDKVEQYPFSLFVACSAEEAEFMFMSELRNFICNGFYLPVACTGSDEK